MIAHIVLFRPRADLTAGDRQNLVRAFRLALREIPAVRRSRVGRRILHGRQYEQVTRENYEYAAILEFDDAAGLTAYLEHPAHARLGELFSSAFEAALIYDYELRDGQDALMDYP